jgi:hypothetical protein
MLQKFHAFLRDETAAHLEFQFKVSSCSAKAVMALTC